MRRLLIGLLFIIVLLTAGQAFAQSQQVLDRIDQAMAHLSERLGRTITRQSHFWSWREEIYPDDALGCPAPGAAYIAEQTRAYQIRITVEGVDYDYRVTPDGSLLVLCDNGRPAFRSDQQSQPGTGTTTAPLPSADWWTWIYLSGTDLLYLVNPDGAQAVVKRPEVGNEALPRDVQMAISRDGRYLVQAVALDNGNDALAVYDFSAGSLISALVAQPGEEIRLTPSAMIFDAASEHVIVAFANLDTAEWRVAVIELATAGVVSQMRESDLALMLPPGAADSDPRMSNVLNGQGTFAPRPAYFADDGGVHVQLILMFAGGAQTYPAFVWYPDRNQADISAYTSIDGDILPGTEMLLYTYQDPGATFLEPTGPFESHNAIAQRPLYGGPGSEQRLYRNSNFYHWRAQWADEGRRIIFQVDEGVNPARWAIYDLTADQAPDLLPVQYINARGVNGGMLTLTEVGAGGADLTFHQDIDTSSVAWVVPPRNGEPRFLWVQPERTAFGLQTIALNDWASLPPDSGGPAQPPPPAGEVHCAGTPPSIVSIGITGRVTFTNGAPLNVRTNPTTRAAVAEIIPEGTQFQVVGGPQCSDGYTWWQIRLESGIIGWAAEGDSDDYFMEPAP